MGNLDLYNKARVVPQEAQKKITGGRLNGFTDINPMWRIKMLTELFGPAGIGWYYEIIDKRVEEGALEEKVAIVDINLFVKHEGEWSKPIQGTGGSMLVAKERNGLYTSDECFKMALTDAISVSCKALGVGADIYYDKDRSKYDGEKGDPVQVEIDRLRRELKMTGSKNMRWQQVLARAGDDLEKQLTALQYIKEKMA